MLVLIRIGARIIKEFYRKFPELQRPRWNATKLKERDLYKIVLFLNEKQVKMFAVEFTKQDWQHWMNYIRAEAFYVERIYAILYYKLLKRFYC